MNNLAVKVEGLSKVYRLGLKDEVPDTLARLLINGVTAPLRNLKKYRSLYRFDDTSLSDNSRRLDSTGALWALRDVSFDLEHGQVLGIVGANGSGKSTLLKILSQITPPTKGSVRIRGNVASLLEVGTGFHPELTGRENVYLNGAILGMKKKDIDRQFDSIVHFSGVEPFLDTPVKRYSSGMRVRLAFAVAAHLDSDILIIDEVLAVGDAAFQFKCLNKMEDVSRSGRTVLFVSHNLQAVSRLCTRSILLNEGQLTHQGPTATVVSHYLQGQTGTKAEMVWEEGLRKDWGPELARLYRFRIKNSRGRSETSFDFNDSIGLEMEYEVVADGLTAIPHFCVVTDSGMRLFTAIGNDPQWEGKPTPPGRYRATAWIPKNLLNEGLYLVDAYLRHADWQGTFCFYATREVAFQVVAKSSSVAADDWPRDYHGLIRPKLEWQCEWVGDEAASA